MLQTAKGYARGVLVACERHGYAFQNLGNDFLKKVNDF